MGRRPKKKEETNDKTTEKENVVIKVKKKRGRKPKPKPEGVQEVKVPKKRGRKPKGGKIIKNISNIHIEPNIKPNVILHLKCSLSDIEPNKLISTMDYNPNISNIEPYNNENMNYHVINEMNNKTNKVLEKPKLNDSDMLLSKNIMDGNKKFNSKDDTRSRSNSVVSTKDEGVQMKDIWKKLKELEKNLHTNNISDKKSACFWCTCDFDNPPIYIPKFFLKDSYHVYGCFCSPECATAHLMKENISSSVKFERYHLLNHIYCKIYDYKKNINPAPNPYYILNKYYGNLSIQEYRKLLKNERLLLVVDKPLTRILPELHQDNNDFLINSNSIPASKYNIMKKRKKESKSSILNKNFGMK
jgi:hypothetical protein